MTLTQAGLTALLAGAIIGVTTWLVDQFRWAKRIADGDRCLCGRFDLTDIEAQHTKFYVHGRTVCQPKCEWIAR